ncbi:MAG: hypothetical protein KIS92_00935 [Planctomycetota bacterium]|nr:hypothetical protein [Planctomycetota bacterium]
MAIFKDYGPSPRGMIFSPGAGAVARGIALLSPEGAGSGVAAGDKKEGDKGAGAATAPDIGQQIAEGFKGLGAQIPGIVEGAVKKYVDSLNLPKPSEKPEEKGGEGKPADDNKNWREAVGALEAKLAQKEAENAVRAAAGKVTWFDANEAVQEILPKVVNKEGKLVVPSTAVKLGIPVPVELSLEEAMQDLSVRKPHWVKTKVDGGTGATGANEIAGATVPSYDALMGNADLLAKWLDARPEETNAVIQAGEAQLRKGK